MVVAAFAALVRRQVIRLGVHVLEADKSGLRVTGTDLDVTTSAHVPCTVQRLAPGRAPLTIHSPSSHLP